MIVGIGVPLAFVAAFMFGAQPLIQKRILDSIRPQTMLVLMDVIYFACIIVFTIINFKIVKHDVLGMVRNTWILIAISAIVFSFFGYMAYVYAVKFSTPHVVAAIVASSPLFTVLISTVFFREKISLVSIVGILLVVAGVVLISGAI